MKSKQTGAKTNKDLLGFDMSKKKNVMKTSEAPTKGRTTPMGKKIKTYFIAMTGYKNGQQNWISGLFDSEAIKIRDIWKEARQYYAEEFDGEFTIISFNLV